MEKISMTLAAAFPTKLTCEQSYAAEMLLHRPDMSLPSDDELDKLLECESLPDELYGAGVGFDEPYNWFQDVAKSIGWWVNLANLAMEKGSLDGNGCYGPNPDLSDRRKDLALFLSRVLEAFPSANDEIAVFGMEDTVPLTATVSLMRRYRLYTRQVESLVTEVWPGINRELLTRPEFYKGPSAGTGQPHVEYVN